jgi:hypothetical protein
MKVFSGRKWVERMIRNAPWEIIKECVDEGWVGECDGMTVEELKKAGHPAIPGMMVDEKLYKPLLEKADPFIWKK